ncbi:MAG: cupredoxin domain-containing protein [Chloroflexi bacterium]|nr:cupredoxin domain-containing protein [Chloroflexota bacterium]
MFRKSLLLIIFATLLAACGGSEGTTAEISAEMTDLMFTPTNFEAPAGAEVTLKLTNSGAVEHNFIILKQGAVYTSGADIKPEDVILNAKLAAGESGEFAFKIDEAGEYAVVCNVPGHLEAGMVGKLVVK